MVYVLQTTRDIPVYCCPDGLDNLGEPVGSYVDVIVPAGLQCIARWARDYKGRPIYRMQFLGYGTRDFFLDEFKEWFVVVSKHEDGNE